MHKPRNVKEETASYSAAPAAKPSALLDTHVIYYGDNIEQLKKLPDACVDLISDEALAEIQQFFKNHRQHHHRPDGEGYLGRANRVEAGVRRTQHE